MGNSDVVSRLTDTSKYTGAHKERFDESGKGKGIAGRENVVKNDGSTSSKTRDHAVETDSASNLKKVVVKPKGEGEDFGTTAKKIMFYQYADKNHAGERIVLHQKKFPTMKQVHDVATKMVPTGKAKLIVDANMKEVKELDGFQEGGKYLVLTSFDKSKLDQAKIPAAFRA